MQEAAQQEICRVCVQQYARYTCPRCQMRYCSKACYQQHGQQCTEAFFRQGAVAELRSTAASDEERQHMQEILRRVHDGADDHAAAMAEALGMPPGSAGGAATIDAGRGGSSSASDEDEVSEAVPLSAATLQRLLEAAQQDGDNDGDGSSGAALDAALQQLGPRELQAFERFVSSGQGSQLVERWQPWWYSPEAGRIQLTARGTRPVKPIAEMDTPAEELGEPGGTAEVSSGASTVPDPPSEPVPPLRTAAGLPASPLVRWRLLEALYAYALALRLYNGDWATDAQDAAGLLLSAAPFLGAQTATAPPATGPEAALQAVTHACDPAGPLAGDRKAANLILGDVAALAALGRSPVICGLADMQRLIATASAAAAPQQASRHSASAAAPPSAAVLPQHQAQVQQPTRRPARPSSKSHSGQQAGQTQDGGGGCRGSGKDKKQLRRQLRLAGMHLSVFLLPWANEQAADVFADVAQAAADEWQLWRDNMGQGQDTGSVPASTARLAAARPSAADAVQQPARPGIAEVDSGGRTRLDSAAAASDEDADSAGVGGGGGIRVPDGSGHGTLHPALASRLSAMSVTGSRQQQRRTALVEELS